jgi:AraC-like DNA-binding protein
MNFSLVNILAVLILFQLLLMILFLFISKRGKKVSNYLLATFFILLFVNILDGLLGVYGFYTKHPSLAHLEDGLIFLFGPLFYFYTKSLVFKHSPIRRKTLIHLVPFVLTTAAYQIFYHLQSKNYQEEIQHAIVEQKLPFFFYVVVFLVYLHLIGYLLASFTLLKVYKATLKEKFSAIDKINLDWLKFVLVSIAIIIGISFINTFLPAVEMQDFYKYSFPFAFIFFFLFINTVVWKGLQQPEIFQGIEGDTKTKVKKVTSISDFSEDGMVAEKLQELMKNEKLYLKSDLTVDQLAERSGYPSKKVSQVINDSFGKNFFDFINSYRIEEAKRIFQEATDPKQTVLEVMYACGFNSKSSFNTIFKEKTGVTPSSYKERFKK